MIKNKKGEKDLLKTISVYGLVFWTVMFIIVSVMISFGIYQYPMAKIIILVLSGLLAYLFTKKTEPKKMMVAVFIGSAFVAIGLLLNLVISYRFDSQIFRSVYLWISYMFVIIGSIAGGCFCNENNRRK